MFGQTLAIARNTFLESIRAPIFFVLVLAGSLLQVFNLLLSAYSMGYTVEELEVSADNKILLDVGLATVFVAATLLAAFIATSVVSREIENKTALTVISKPVGRPLFIVGKFLGAGGAMVLGTVTMLAFFLLMMHHGVMSTARDSIHLPVVVAGGSAIIISVGVGVWTNFFYGWVFPSVASAMLAPLAVAAWFFAMFFNADFTLVESLGDSFKPQVTLISGCLVLAVLVITAIAIAASTRLGQVMTIVVCAGVFLLGLLSNYFLGRFAFDNTHFARVDTVETATDDVTLARPGDTVTIELTKAPNELLRPGEPVYYGPAASGVALAVPTGRPFTGDAADNTDVRNTSLGRQLVIRDFAPEERTLELVNAGGVGVSRLPREGDYLFLQPTETRPVAFAAWAVIPNLQAFWLVDAVSQGSTVTPRYLVLVSSYALVQITGLLALAVLLFQTRDVG
jgi:ABC-type transport system involved in multi-copper enzyme maturation permease subunit